MTIEARRVATLDSYAIIDTPAEPAFDAIAIEAARALRCRSALVSFIDADRQWYKARVGVEGTSIARALSFCTHAIEDDEVLVVPDARLDPRFIRNPAVTGGLRLRFYAGAPIKALNRMRLGTICVFDPEPRDMPSVREQRLLSALAARTAELLERRRWATPRPQPGPAQPAI